MHLNTLHFITLCMIFILPTCVTGQELDYRQGEVIVQFKQYTQAKKVAQGFQTKYYDKYRVTKELYPEIELHLLRFDESQFSMDEILQELKNDNEVLHVQANYLAEPRTTPNDGLFSDQWYLTSVQAEEAWNITTGGNDINGREIVLAVLDNGFDVDHQDLAPNLWLNTDEIPDDGIDNDGNGFTDDYEGWNFSSNNDTHGTTTGAMLHGTTVAGVAGARGNNQFGVSGAIWDVKLMFLSGLVTEAEIIEALRYLADTRDRYNKSNGQEGAYIVVSSMSIGIRAAFANDHPIWCNLYDTVGNTGILNVCATDNLNADVDIAGDMPTTCTSDYMIAVTNTDRFNTKVPSAAFGALSIDIGAPGVDNLTTAPNDNYSFELGTSVATPIVAGTVALLYSAPCAMLADQALSNPSGLALNMKGLIYDGIDRDPSLNQITSQGGVINMAGSMEALNLACNGQSTNENMLDVIKNPIAQFGEDIIIDYIAQADGEVLIQLFNVKGSLMIERKVERSFFGVNRISLSTYNGLAPGIYIVSLTLPGNESISEKVVVY